MSKLITLSQAAALINNGDSIAFGGNVLHRAPMAMVREIIRQKKRNLMVIKTAGAMDVDMLCLGGCVYSVDAGFISYETEFGLASHYRKGVEGGKIKANEHACYTVICALRAAQMGVPFMPVRGMRAGDLLKTAEYFKVVQDPFSGEDVTVVKALRPDVAVIHVQEADKNGNAVISGPKYEDVLLSRAAAKVIITAENITSSVISGLNPEKIDIPHFLVTAVVHAPKGAAPCSCDSFYEVDCKGIDTFKSLSSVEGLDSYLASYERKDRCGNAGRAGNI